MNLKLSSQEEQSLKAIIDYTEKSGYPPTRLELAQMIGLGQRNGKSQAQALVRSLEQKGYVQRGKGWRSIKIIKYV